MLEQIVAEMKANALANKLDVKNGKIPSDEDSFKRVAVGNILFNVMFTCDVLSENKLLWHLSLSTFPYGPVPLEQAEQLRSAFFGGWESVEMPSFLHGDNMRQYIGRVS